MEDMDYDATCYLCGRKLKRGAFRYTKDEQGRGRAACRKGKCQAVVVAAANKSRLGVGSEVRQ